MPAGKQQAVVFSIAQDTERDSLLVKEVSGSTPIEAKYASLVPTAIKGQNYLLGYAAGGNHLDVYHFTAGKPWLKELAAKPKVGAKTDIIEPFVVGNAPHIAAYTAKNGVLELYALKHDFSLSKPYEFFRNHEPGLSQDFTTLKSFNSFGQIVFLGYKGANGYVAMYTLAVTAASPADVPPLLLTAVWSHQWAKGWTRFAFFQLGGENFFLKTNTWKPNVNIDHVMDGLTTGTAEVGTNLVLDNAQQLDIVQAFTLGNGDPYFVTYMAKGGQLAFYRFHGDCLGWTAVAKTTTKTGASQVVPLTTANNQVYLVVA
jgi:hypothetical protein